MTLEQPLRDVPRAAELTEVKKVVHKLKGSVKIRTLVDQANEDQK